MSALADRSRFHHDGVCLHPCLPLHDARGEARLRGLMDKGRGADVSRLYALEALLYGCADSLVRAAPGLTGWLETMRAFMDENAEAFQLGGHEDACALLTRDSLAPREAGRDSVAEEALRAMAQSKAAVSPRLFDGEGFERTRAEIMRYPLLVLPGCRSLTREQMEFLISYDRAGGRIQAHGEFAEGTGLASLLQAGGRFIRTEDSPYPEVAMARFAAGFRQWVKPFRSFTLPQPLVEAHRAGGGQSGYLHLLNYNYDETVDRVLSPEGFGMTIKGAKRAWLLVPGQQARPLETVEEGASLRVSVNGLPLYALLRFDTGGEAG